MAAKQETSFIREKMNLLTNLMQQTELELFQLELHVEVASASTGDKQVDANLGAVAQNAKTQMLVHRRKMAVYQAKLEAYRLELNALPEGQI